MEGKGGVCSAGQTRIHDSSDSDSEPEAEPSRTAGGGEPFAGGSFPGSQVIHSGHFMVSSPHSDSVQRRRKSGGSLRRYDFDTVNRTWCQTYRYGPFSSGSLSIDPTLTRLFECMSLAYRWVLSCYTQLKNPPLLTFCCLLLCTCQFWFKSFSSHCRAEPAHELTATNSFNKPA